MTKHTVTKTRDKALAKIRAEYPDVYGTQWGFAGPGWQQVEARADILAALGEQASRKGYPWR